MGSYAEREDVAAQVSVEPEYFRDNLRAPIQACHVIIGIHPSAREFLQQFGGITLKASQGKRFALRLAC